MIRFLLPMLGLVLNFYGMSSLANAVKKPGYYGLDFYEKLDQLTDQKLKIKLNEILNSGHVMNPDGYDNIVTTCDQKKSCYSHNSIGYDLAKKQVFANLFLVSENNSYSVTEVYCDFQLSDSAMVGPNVIPPNEIANIEHTWPQSKFTSKYQRGMQKSDLHHLFPTDSSMNNHRSSFPFGVVEKETEKLKCSLSKIGHAANNEIVFEPPDSHKGNVARAIFYFAVKYEMDLSSSEEEALRKWNEIDPVDEAEALRNEEIFKIQKVRNPFIDFSDLIKRINFF